MPIASLLSVLSVLRGEELDAAQRKQLMHEALLLTLARASSSDSYVADIEVSTIQTAMKDAIDVDVSEADIREAAESEMFEAVTLETALLRLSGLLSDEDRMVIATKLGDVIRSDARVNQFELDYFEIINSMSGDEAFQTRPEWEAVRKAAQKPLELQ